MAPALAKLGTQQDHRQLQTIHLASLSPKPKWFFVLP